MNATTWLNGAASCCAVGLSVCIGGMAQAPELVSDRTETLSQRSITDASGHTILIRPFRRIVSGSAVADDLLVELCEPDRIVAFTAYGAASPVGYRYGGKSQVASEQDAEGILALKPDLFLTNNIGPSANLSPLRSSGVEVFDLGEMRGLSTFLANARTIATLIGHPERGERFAASFARRFDHVAAGSDARLRKRGLYLSGYGGQLFGGTTGTSYHDVLVHAGLVDAAAGTFTNWPQYSAEQILTLDPDVLVTKPGMKDLLCRGSGLDGLKACANGAIIEVPAEIIDDPGALMLDAAELIHARMVAPRALAGAGP